MLAKIRVMHTTRGHLSRETQRVSIRAVPKNYLIYQGNPDKDPFGCYAGLRGSVFNDDVDKVEKSCAQH
jgi:hypothetical protein